MRTLDLAGYWTKARLAWSCSTAWVIKEGEKRRTSKVLRMFMIWGYRSGGKIGKEVKSQGIDRLEKKESKEFINLPEIRKQAY